MSLSMSMMSMSVTMSILMVWALPSWPSQGIMPSRIFLLMMACHRLLYQGWWKVHWEGKKDFDEVLTGAYAPGGRVVPHYVELDLPALLDLSGEPGAEPDEEGGGVREPQPIGEDGALDEFLTTVPDEKAVYHKPERVRAARAGTWIANPTKFIQDVYTAVLATRGCMSLLHFLLKDQKEASWTGSKGLDTTLVQFTVPSRSPAVSALDSYSDLMDERPDDLFFILDGSLASRWWISCNDSGFNDSEFRFRFDFFVLFLQLLCNSCRIFNDSD